MRSLKNRLGRPGWAGLIMAGLLTAAAGCDETEVAGYYESGYYYDDYSGYDSEEGYTGSDVLETYLSDFVVY